MEIGLVGETSYATSPICMEQVATPTFSPAAGSYSTAQNVTISCATENATIYYTTDGTAPTTSSSVYSSAIAVTETTTIKAMAVKTDMANSEVATGTFTIESTITVTNTPTSPFPYTGGTGSFDFSITNPVTGATVTAVADSWMTATVSNGTVNFQVAQNDGVARSGNITLNYVSNGTTLTSTSVSISQEANPYTPGSQERPYSVTEAWNIINGLSNNTSTTDTVHVVGTISRIDEVEVIQYHNATYYITDGNKTVKVQYGRNLDDTDFYDEDEIQVGDRVVVYGQLMRYGSSTYEIAPYNYLVSLERDVEPPLFLPTSCMMASDEYAIVYLYSNNAEAHIFYTLNGDEPNTESTLYDGNGISLVNVTGTVTVKAIAYSIDYTMHSAVNSATYRMVSPNTHGLYNNPFTVQQALDSLDYSSTIEGVYVRGTVCADPEFSLSNFMNANYYIADDLGDENQLYVFRGKYYYGDPFTSEEDLQYGDIVTVFGDLTIYTKNGVSTKEFTAKNYIVELERPTSAFIRPAEVSINNCHGVSSSLTVTYNSMSYIISREVQFCDVQGIQVDASTYSWLTATVNSNTGNIDFQVVDNEGNTPRTAYLKLVVNDSGNVIETNVVPITQGICSANDFATLPFHYVGNGAAPAGITSDGLGENYGASPYLKFDGVNDYMTLAFDEMPGELTFDIKGDNFRSSEFYLQTSTNNLDWNDLAIYTTQDMINSWAIDNPKREIARVIGSPMAQSFPELDANVRYIRWIMVTHSSSSKVRLGEIHLYKPIIYYNIAVTQPTIDETQVGTITTLEMAQENETVNLSIEYNANDYYFLDWVVEDASGNPVAVTDNHFTMPASNVNVTATLVEANQPCMYAYSVNGTMGSPQEAVVGDVITLPSSNNIVFNDQTFYFRGWTTDANDVTNLIRANSSYTVRQDVTFHAVYYQQIVGFVAEKHYAKVTNELSDWSGDYLIVYEDGNVAFNGGLQTLDDVGNTISVAISDGIITASETLDAAKFTIAAVDGGYSIQSASGKFIGQNADTNELDENTEYDENYVNVISYNDVDGEIDIVSYGGSYLRYNSSSNQRRFRYFKSSTYTGQQPIQLYRYVGNVSNLYTRVFVDNPSGSLTIAGPSIVPNGSVLNLASITNTLGADRLVVEEGAQLVTSSDVNASIKRFINPYQGSADNYYLISSPVDGQNPVGANMTNNNYDLYYFDQSAQGEEWQNYEANTFVLESGKGYLYANSFGDYITMSGLMEATAYDVTIEHVAGKNLAGWNLIGNPYPCNVTINKPFYRLEGGTALATLATDNSVAIAPMEGVFVYADSEEDVSFTKAPTTSTTGRGGNTLSLRVRRNQNTKDGRVEGDNAIIRFGEGSLLRKLVLNPDLPQIYVAQDGTDYAIVNAEAEGELPISFRAAENGNYTISVDAEEVSFGYLHLIDNMTGVDVDLLALQQAQEPASYTFDANTADYACRFKLVFATHSIFEDADGGNETFAYFNGSAWVVNAVEGDAILQVVDMTGRVILSNSAKAGVSVNAMPQGIYVLRLIDGDNVKTQKIINK